VKKLEEATPRTNKEYKKIQKTVSGTFYIIIVCASIIVIGGCVWTLADIFIAKKGKLALFLDLNFGYQVAIIGGLLAGLFFLLIFFFGLFKKSSSSLIRFIYKKRELEEKYKNRKGVKIAAGGLLVSLIGIIVGVVLAIAYDLLIDTSGGSFSLLGILDTTGPWILVIGIGLFLFVGVALFMIYFWKNGYYIILRLLGLLEKEEKK